MDVWENEFDYGGLPRPDLDDIASYYNPPQSGFWLALDQDDIIGTIGLKDQGADICHLKRMAVAKDYRQQGVGTQLFNTLKEFARKQGHKTILAGMVPENTTAINFYKKHGFTENDFVPEEIIAVHDSICLKYSIN